MSDKPGDIPYAPAGPPFVLKELTRMAAEVELEDPASDPYWAFRPLDKAGRLYRERYAGTLAPGESRQVVVDLKGTKAQWTPKGELLVVGYKYVALRAPQDGLLQWRRIVVKYARRWDRATSEAPGPDSGGYGAVAARLRAARLRGELAEAHAPRPASTGADPYPRLAELEEEDRLLAALARVKVYEALVRFGHAPPIDSELLLRIIRANAHEHKAHGTVERLATLVYELRPWRERSAFEDLTEARFYRVADLLTERKERGVRQALETHPRTRRFFSTPKRGGVRPSRQGKKGGAYPEVLDALEELGRELASKIEQDRLRRDDRWAWSPDGTDAKRDPTRPRGRPAPGA